MYLVIQLCLFPRDTNFPLHTQDSHLHFDTIFTIYSLCKHKVAFCDYHPSETAIHVWD